ncbi:aminotransferase class V-fold PLP-dependent enzyme [Planctomonas sp. JC2975]|uniref:aminotransferase class V-fold PLP-dependent enzyme n=1 Tax=Planctomonas sp. JC2975 TaxID=2729626 RepID=UPI001473E4CB|nr:aminotransferase class V-fold PLP-dependent enzyme [Planctomonas sp. JC2975]
MTTVEEFAEGFLEEPGYLDFGRVGPLSASVVAEVQGINDVFSRARFGSLDAFRAEDARMRDAASRLTGFDAEQIVFQPNVGTGLMHAMFGLTGGVLVSGAEFPSITFAAARASEALHAVQPIWLETDHGRVTPGTVKEQLTSAVTAVAVSLVDSRTGFVADIDGIRQVIGDRLLIVDAVQGFGVVDAPYEVADVVVVGAEKWLRAGWGAAFMALSQRAIDNLTPVWSGHTGAGVVDPFDELLPPVNAASAFTVARPDSVAQARLSAALEDVLSVGVDVIEAAVADRVDRVIDLADEYGIPISSARETPERAGIVVLEPSPERLTLLGASLFNHGITATTREHAVRLSVHVSCGDETLEMLRGAFTSFATA